MRPGYLVAFWLLVLGATSIRVDIGPVTPDETVIAHGAPAFAED